MDDNSLAAILGMPLSGQTGMLTIPEQGGLGKVPGMGQVDLGKGLSGVPGYEGTEKIPGKQAPEAVFNTGGAQAGAGAGGSGGNAAMGLEAMKLLAGMSQPQAMGAVPGAQVAPRGNQTKLDAVNNTGAIDPRLRLSMAQLLFGGR